MFSVSNVYFFVGAGPTSIGIGYWMGAMVEFPLDPLLPAVSQRFFNDFTKKIHDILKVGRFSLDFLFRRPVRLTMTVSLHYTDYTRDAIKLAVERMEIKGRDGEKGVKGRM